jgi:hypothetical protein
MIYGVLTHILMDTQFLHSYESVEICHDRGHSWAKSLRVMYGTFQRDSPDLQVWCIEIDYEKRIARCTLATPL